MLAGRVCSRNLYRNGFNTVLLHNPNKFRLPVWCRFGRYLSSKASIKVHQSQMMAKGLPQKKPIAGVKDVILVASGKGGVGKSTVSELYCGYPQSLKLKMASKCQNMFYEKKKQEMTGIANLATALATLDPSFSVGLLDADVFGPSIPYMMNLSGEPLLTDDNKMIPLVNYNVKCMSMGFLIEEKSAVVWRGLMVMGALERLLRQVDWGTLDCLVVDSPPGTGDTLLSLIQNIPISGVVMVSTPERLALQVVRRGATMLQKLSVPIIGIVQNMSVVECPRCSHQISIFGDGTKKIADELGIPLLTDIPLASEAVSKSESGKPIVISDSASPQSRSYKMLAHKVYEYLQTRGSTRR